MDLVFLQYICLKQRSAHLNVTDPAIIVTGLVFLLNPDPDPDYRLELPIWEGLNIGIIIHFKKHFFKTKNTYWGLKSLGADPSVAVILAAL
jgi:hypothetical protein